MDAKRYLTPAELVAHLAGVVTVGTLANWRTKRTGPPYTKIGGKVLYQTAQVNAWEEKQTHSPEIDDAKNT